MSVVNKMLQDLEARQSQTDDINADYQPPQKKQSKLLILVLLVFAIAAISFALTDKRHLFDEIKNSQDSATTNYQALPAATIKKMPVESESIPAQEQFQPPTSATNSFQAKIESLDTQENIPVSNTALINQQILPQAMVIATNKLVPKQNIEIQNNQLDTPATPEPTSSFSMTGSSQENNSSRLKQRIAESLNNDNLGLARTLLQQLLEAEADNIKARKKLASLLFAEGDYARTKRLLLEGIELYPVQSDLRLMLARLYVVQKEPLQAIKILTGSEPSVVNKAEYLAYRAALAQQLKQTELAKSDYQTLTNIESSNAKWWLGLAIARDQLGEGKMAVQAYQKASSLDQLDRSVNDFMQQRITVLAGSQ